MKSINAQRLTTVGLDLGKRFFHAYGVDGEGEMVVNRRLPRSRVGSFFAALPRCRVAMETCGGAHYWGRLLAAMGHDVKLILAQFVRPYVKSNKNDAVDAEAICEAVRRPGMRFAALKDVEVQAMLAQNRTGVAQLIALVQDPDDDRLPDLARTALAVLVAILETLRDPIAELDRELLQWHRTSPVSQRLGSIPGVGPLTATALTASLGDGRLSESVQFSVAIDSGSPSGATGISAATWCTGPAQHWLGACAGTAPARRSYRRAWPPSR